LLAGGDQPLPGPLARRIATLPALDPRFPTRSTSASRVRPLLLAVLALAAAHPAAAVPYRAEAVGDGYRVRFDPADLKLITTPEGTRVEIRDGIDPQDPAAPALPTITVLVEIPSDLTVDQLTSAAEDEEVLATGIALAVAGAPTRIDEPPSAPAAVAPARLALPWPAAQAQVLGESFGRGHRLVTIELAPVRWDAASQRLVRATAIRFRLHLIPASAADRPLVQTRVVPEWERDYAGTLAQALGQPLAEAARAVGAPVRNRLAVTFPPSANGAPVAYVIVTNEALRAPFESLAAWKTQKGRNAVVVTQEWITTQYPNGADRSEQLRFFLKDAYQNWGTLFVLLGGDTDVLPSRLGVSTLFASPDDPALIPTDLYYACLDGNWNADGDDRVGEAITDNVDLVPELFVGRAPVSTLAEAATFVQRTLQHEQSPPVNGLFPASIVFMAEHLGFMDGAVIAEDAYALVPSTMRRVRMYESSGSYPGSVALTKAAALDSLDAGFGWFHHVGHGFRNTMSVADGSINNGDADALVNGPRRSFTFAINCSSASIDFNTIGERFLKNVNGGAVGYIGTTRIAYPQVSRRYQNEFYRLAFVDSVETAGECLMLCRLPWVAS